MNANIGRLFCAIFLLFLSQTLTVILIPLAAVSLGLGATLVGLLVALPQVTGLLIDIPLAAWSDAIGRRIPILLGCAAGILSAFLLMGSIPVLLATGALVFGAAMSLSTGPALAFVTEAVAPEAHARIQGYNGAIQGLSAMTGALTAGVLVTAFGPSQSFWSLAVVLVVVAAAAFGLREKVRSATVRPPTLRNLAGRYARVIELLRTEPAIRMAAAVSLSYQLQLMTLENAFIPIYLVSSRGYTGTTIGLLLAARSLVGVILSAFFGRVLAKYGLVRPIIVGNAVGLAAAVAVPLVVHPIALVLLFACQGAGGAFVPATSNLLITSATNERERAIGFSANFLIGRIGGLAFPIAFGVAAQVGGFNLLFIVAAAVGCVTIGAMSIIARSLGPWNEPDDIGGEA